MTIITGTDHYGHHSHVMRMSRVQAPLWTGKTPVVQEGIERKPQERADPDRPLSERHAAILELVETEPTSAQTIAEAIGVSRASVDSGLYSLSVRGLVARRPYKGWTRL